MVGPSGLMGAAWRSVGVAEKVMGRRDDLGLVAIRCAVAQWRLLVVASRFRADAFRLMVGASRLGVSVSPLVVGASRLAVGARRVVVLVPLSVPGRT